MGNSLLWRVIICDSDQSNLENLHSNLNEHFEVILAQNGMDALEKLDLYEPDLLIFDMEAPGVDGPGAARAIRKNSRFSQIPILLMGEQEPDKADEEFKKLGIVRFIKKPIDAEKLSTELQEYFEQSSNRISEKRFSMTDIEEREGNISEENHPEAPKVEELSTGWSNFNNSRASKHLYDSAHQKSDNRNERVRIVALDDDVDVVNYIGAVLEDEYDVIRLNDPVTAVKKMKQYQPDIILLDVMMPLLTGYQISQMIQIERELHSVKVMFVTSRCCRDEYEYAYRLGASEFLSKPFQPQELLDKIEKITQLSDFFVRAKTIPFSEIKQEVPALS